MGHCLERTVENGTVLVGSDYHRWPGARQPTAFRAFVRFTRSMRPAGVILDGDMIDGATTSKHASIGWETKPTVREEIDALTVDLDELIDAHPAPEEAFWDWALGNHDKRPETILANLLPQFRGLPGAHLRDHFPAWSPCWRVNINDNELNVKHRFKGGKGHMNALHAGTSLATGHDHKLYSIPFSDYRGTRYAVHTGTLSAGPVHVQEQFVHYVEDNPLDWQPGFVVFTFRDRRLLPPELVHVINEREGLIAFRGDLRKV